MSMAWAGAKQAWVAALLLAALLPSASAPSTASAAPASTVLVPPFDISRYPHPKPFRDRPAITPVFVVPQALVEPPRNVAVHAWISPAA